MINFIDVHLVHKIEKTIKEKQGILKHEGFYYFDEPVKNGKKVINRINRWCPYIKEQTLPTSWYSLGGNALAQIFNKLKNNEFYIYRKIDGKDYKVRLKKDV